MNDNEVITAIENYLTELAKADVLMEAVEGDAISFKTFYQALPESIFVISISLGPPKLSIIFDYELAGRVISLMTGIEPAYWGKKSELTFLEIETLYYAVFQVLSRLGRIEDPPPDIQQIVHLKAYQKDESKGVFKELYQKRQALTSYIISGGPIFKYVRVIAGEK